MPEYKCVGKCQYAPAIIGTYLEKDKEQEPVECQYAKDVAMPEYKCVGKCQYAPAIIGTYLEKDKEQEPVAWVDLLKDAQQIVESKFLWKRFIDGTPLANDIACWMADFAEQHTTPPQRKPLTDEHPLVVFAKECVLGAYQESELADAAKRAIEAARGIKGDA